MSTIKATTLSNLAGSQTISTDRVAQGTAAAWVNFNGSGTVAIRAAYNVSSITDNNTGDYTVNFTTALADANFATVAGGRIDTTDSDANNTLVGERRAARTTSSVRLTCQLRSVATTVAPSNDPDTVSVVIFR